LSRRDSIASAIRFTGMRGFRVATIACACLPLIACGGTVGKASIPRTVATRLANESDAVAASLQGGDACAAVRKAQLLRRDVSRAIKAGSIPQSLAGPARATALRLSQEIACTPPPPPTPSQPEPAPNCNDNGHGHHKGERGKGCD